MYGPSGDALCAYRSELLRVDRSSGTIYPTGLDQSVIPLVDAVTHLESREAITQRLHHQFSDVLSRGEVAALVERLIESKVLVEWPLPATPVDRVSPIAFVGIPTNKPFAAIERVVVSTHAALATQSQTPLILFAQDDSEAFGGSIIQNLAPTLGHNVPVFVSSRDSFTPWFTTITNHLSPEDQETVNKAVGLNADDTWRTGATRNRMLLTGSGHRIVSGDDDQLSRFCDSSGTDNATHISSRFNPMRYQPFPSMEYRDRSVEFAAQDPVAIHDQWLSREQIVGEGTQIDGASAELLHSARSGHAIALATMIGLCGDMGQRMPLNLLASGVFPKDGYSSLLLSGVGIAAPAHNAISDSPFFRSSHIGLDLRNNSGSSMIMPPFPATGRNADGIFGAARSCAALVDSPAVTVHIAKAVDHLSKGTHPLPASVLGESGYRANDILLLTLLNLPSLGSLEAVGHALRAVAGRSPAMVAAHVTPLALNHLEIIESQIEDYAVHGPCEEEANIALAALTTRIRNGSVLQDGVTWDTCRDEIAAYGALLLVWRSVMVRAQEIPWQERGLELPGI